HSRQRDRQAVPDICRRAAAQGVLTYCFPQEGSPVAVEQPACSPRMDVYELYARTCQVVEELRTGQSPPVLFECHCYRWKEHVGPGHDYDAGYRRAADCEPWLAADPLAIVAA